MALKAVLASKTELEALPEAVRALYIEKDGKYRLDAENVDYEGGLSRSLESERSNAATLRRQLADLTNKLGDLDPEKAREAMGQLRQLQEQAELGEVPEQFRGVIDKIVQKRVERLQADHQTQIQAYEGKIKGFSTEKEQLTGTLRSLMLNNGIRELAAKKGVKPEHYDDVVARFTVIGVEGIKWDFDPTKPEGEQIIARQKNGEVAYGKDASKPMPFEEGFELLAAKVPGFFMPNQGGGAAGGTGDKKVKNGVFAISEDDAKDRGKYLAAEKEAARLGVPLAIE